jgi:hypothetical protein
MLENTHNPGAGVGIQNTLKRRKNKSKICAFGLNIDLPKGGGKILF